MRFKSHKYLITPCCRPDIPTGDQVRIDMFNFVGGGGYLAESDVWAGQARTHMRAHTRTCTHAYMHAHTHMTCMRTRSHVLMLTLKHVHCRLEIFCTPILLRAKLLSPRHILTAMTSRTRAKTRAKIGTKTQTRSTSTSRPTTMKVGAPVCWVRMCEKTPTTTTTTTSATTTTRTSTTAPSTSRINHLLSRFRWHGRSKTSTGAQSTTTTMPMTQAAGQADRSPVQSVLLAYSPSLFVLQWD